MSKPETLTSLAANVKTWLAEQGYPLEMEVARLFREAGFSVLQSEYYKDPSTSQHREIDVVASIQRRSKSILRRISFVVECKASRDKPWVVFTSSEKSLAAPARIAQNAGNIFGRSQLQRLSHSEEVQALSLFGLPERPGYAVTQAFTTGKDLPYEACVGAASSAVAITSAPSNLALIALPIVVIEGKLLECFLVAGGDVAVQEVREATLVWRNPIINLPHTIIRLLTLPAVPAFIASVGESAASFLEIAGRNDKEEDGSGRLVIKAVNNA
jgi:hypothetical protein